MVTDITIKKGYKKTELGVIPEDWEVFSFGEIISLRKQKYDSRKEGANEFCVELEHIGQGTGTLIGHSETTESSSIKNIFQKDDILFGRLRAYLKKYWKATRDGVSSTEIWSLLAKSQYVIPDYIFQIVQTNEFIEASGESYGTHMPRTDWNVIKNLLIPLPHKKEQTNIASILSDTEGLIERLEKLIAKKKAIKQGAMQELLTGKKRLPGFSGKREMKKLGDLFAFSGGFSASRDQLSSEGHCYLHYGDIHKSSKTFIDVCSDYQNIPKLDIPLNRVSPVSLLEDGDVVFVDASEDDEGTSRHVVIVKKDNIHFISGLHTIVAKSKTNELNHQYRRFCFQTTDIKQQFYFYAVGTKVSGISKTNIAKLTIHVPSLPEQTAIATILSDMDAEIEQLEQKLDKYKMIKQGMMQELLTGKIRLI